MGSSTFIGAVFGVIIVASPILRKPRPSGDVVSGIVWWVIGAPIMMPLILGMTDMVFVIGQMQWMILSGHIIYGLLTAFVFMVLVKHG